MLEDDVSRFGEFVGECIPMVQEWLYCAKQTPTYDRHALDPR
jgi:hypothetical protein